MSDWTYGKENRMEKILAYCRYLKKKVLRMILKRYAVYFLSNLEKEKKRIAKKKRVMKIINTDYEYSFYNVCFHKNIMSLILYSLWRGYIPLISVNEDNPENIQWEWYFQQPSRSFFEIDSLEEYESIVCPINTAQYTPEFEDLTDLQSVDFTIWNKLFRIFTVFNEKTEHYIQQEIMQLGGGTDTMGVLMRGTDYLKLKPAGHPVQPEVTEIIDIVKNKLKENSQYSKIYVATEEEKLFLDFKSHFTPKYVVQQNKRHYIGDIFVSNNCSYVSDVSLNIDDEIFVRGLDYLSSLVIISLCDGIVAGISGGVQGCMYLRNDFERCNLIYKGKY